MMKYVEKKVKELMLYRDLKVNFGDLCVVIIRKVWLVKKENKID